jgi:8-oxo-dGTP pyrophosphatase MutT (NUDIX family)
VSGAGFTHLGDEPLFEGHVISLYRARFRGPDGGEFEREVVRHPGAVSVVPLTDDGRVVLVRQFRAPLDRFLLEIPAGKRDVAGEPPEETARRELAEEVGLVATRLTPLVVFHNSVGFCDEESHVFLGTGLVETERDLQGVEEEHMDEVRVPLADTPAMIASGQITDGKTVIGLLLALRAVEEGTAFP